MKNVAVLTQGIWQLKSPHPQEFAIQGKKNANAQGSAWIEIIEIISNRKKYVLLHPYQLCLWVRQ